MIRVQCPRREQNLQGPSTPHGRPIALPSSRRGRCSPIFREWLPSDLQFEPQASGDRPTRRMAPSACPMTSASPSPRSRHEAMPPRTVKDRGGRGRLRRGFSQRHPAVVHGFVPRLRDAIYMDGGFRQFVITQPCRDGFVGHLTGPAALPCRMNEMPRDNFHHRSGGVAGGCEGLDHPRSPYLSRLAFPSADAALVSKSYMVVKGVNAGRRLFFQVRERGNE